MHELRNVRTFGLSLLAVGMLLTGFLAVLPGSAEAAFVPEWTAEPDLELGRAQAVVVTDDDGMIYVVGGVADTGTYDPVANVSVLDPYTGVWAELAPMPTAVRGACGEVGNDDRIYIIGGVDAFTAVTLVQIYDPETDSWSAGTPAPEALWEAKSATYSDYIYVLGGEGSLGDDSDCYIYNTYSDSWSTMTNLPEPRISGDAVMVGSSIYYIGGCSLGYTDPQDTVYRYYIWGSAVWEEVAPLPVPIASHAVVEGADGMLYVLGGSNTAYNSVDTYEVNGFAYDYYNDAWTDLPDRSVGKKYLGAAATEDGRVFAVGGNNGTDVFTTVESIATVSASVEATPGTVPIGSTVVITFSFDFAYATEEYSYVYWYMISDDDVVMSEGYIEVPLDATGMFAVDIESYFALGDYEMHMYMDVNVETGYVYWDDYVVPVTVVDGDTVEEQIQALEDALADLEAQLAELNDSMAASDAALAADIAALEDALAALEASVGTDNQALMDEIAALQEQVDALQSSIDAADTTSDDDDTMTFAIIGLLVVVIVLLLVMMVMGRKTVPPPPAP